MTKTKSRRYDAAAYLKSEADCALYLQAVMEEAHGDSALVIGALSEITRARGMMLLARDTGLTYERLYQELAPGGNPSFASILKVCKALGVKLTAVSAHAKTA